MHGSNRLHTSKDEEIRVHIYQAIEIQPASFPAHCTVQLPPLNKLELLLVGLVCTLEGLWEETVSGGHAYFWKQSTFLTRT